MDKKKSKLARKFVLGFVILGITIITAAGITGYFEFKKSIEQQYNDEAYNIANIAASYITEDIAKEYGKIAKDYSNGIDNSEIISEIIASDSYKRLQNLFATLREKTEANDIYLVYCNTEILNNYQGTKENWYPFTYILDCYTIEDYSYVLGNQGPINPAFIASTTEIVKTGARVNNYFVSKSDYGYNTTALITISMGDENLALGVEIPMITIETSIRNYLIIMLLSTVGIVAIGIVVYVLYLWKNVIDPINTVSYETSNFVANHNQISTKLDDVDTDDEIENLSKSVLKMEIDIKEYIKNLTKITAEKERIGAELDVARDIQNSMLPCIFPAFPDRQEIDIYATMLAAKEVGGDFYDFFMIDDKHLAIVVADVSGKGVPAALFMVIGKTLIKDHTTPGSDLGEVFSIVNNMLCESNSEGLFITAFEGVLNLETGEFRYVNAGHEMPFIARKGEPFKLFKVKSAFVLAGMEDIKYKECVTILNPGDRIYLYTDGVPEATNSENKLFGMERTEASLNKHINLLPNELLPKIKEDIDAFVGEAPQFDDITMLCLDYHGSNANNSITVKAEIENQDEVLDFLTAKLEEHDASMKAITQISVAIDELFSNICFYGYENQEKGDITVKADCDDEKIVFSLIDNGMAFNPLEMKEPDTSLSIEERGIGGLGIFIVKKTMDEMVYERKDNQNILTITKKIK